MSLISEPARADDSIRLAFKLFDKDGDVSNLIVSVYNMFELLLFVNFVNLVPNITVL